MKARDEGPLQVVSGWTDDDRVMVVHRRGDAIALRAFRASWSFYLDGADDGDRASLARHPAVVGIAREGRYTRIETAGRYARKDLCWALKRRNVATLEADVMPLRRLLSDAAHLQISSDFRIAYIDLELDSRQSFDAMRTGKARILACAVAYVDAGGAVVSHTQVLEQDSDDAECAMLSAFIERLWAFDLILAWAGTWGRDETFDFAVLRERCARLGIARADARPIQWHRWALLDMLDVYQTYNLAHESGAERASYKLGDVGRVHLGRGKVEFDASKTWEVWDSGPAGKSRIDEYVRGDVELLPALEAATGYVALHLEVARLCRCIPDTDSLKTTHQGDGFLLRLGKVHGHHWPERQRASDAGQYEGAAVMEPTKLGAISGVHVADFASLYPSIIRGFNLSPETMIPWIRDVGRGRVETIPKDELPPHVALTSGAHFRTDVRGMFPIALDTLVEARKRTAVAMAQHPVGSVAWEREARLNHALKVIANSFYGIIGSPWSRFFARDVAGAITEVARWLIRYVIDTARKAGLNPFYSDTDSCFVEGDGARFGEVVRELNEKWPALLLREFGATTSHVKLEFEKSMERIVLVTAKRYAARWRRYKGRDVAHDAPGAIEVKGLEYKRGDTLRLAREMQRELIDMLLRVEVDEGGAWRGAPLPSIEELRAFVARWRSRVVEGELSLEDVMLSQSVEKPLNEYVQRYTSEKCMAEDGKGKCGHPIGGTHVDKDVPDVCPRCGATRRRTEQPVHVRVAKELVRRGEHVGVGTRVTFLVVVSEKKTIDAVPVGDEGALARIDRAYYWDSRVYSPTQRVLEAVYPHDDWNAPAVPKQPRAAKVAAAKARAVDSDDAGPLFARVVPREGLRLVVELRADACDAEQLGRLAQAVKATAEAHPGPAALEVVVVAGDARTPTLTPLRVSVAPKLRAEIEALTGKGTAHLIQPEQPAG